MMTNNNENIEAAILFDVKEEALSSFTLSEHISRLTEMRDYLQSAIANNRGNLNQLKQHSKQQTSELKSAYQILQTQTRQQLDRMKKYFEPAMNNERKLLSEMKNEVGKINSEQLSTKKVVLNCEAMIDHCQNQIGFVELKSNHRN